MAGTSTLHVVGARVHRLFGCSGAGEPMAGDRSPWLVAIDSIESAADVARGWCLGRGTELFRAADDGFGNLLRVPE